MEITVSQLGNFLKALIDNESVLSDISVRGEVSTLRFSADAVCFVLKDELAQIDCFFYTQSASALRSARSAGDSRVNPVQFKAGDIVVVTGKPSYYAKGGKLSFWASSIKELNVKGSARTQLLLLKDKLEKEGLFSSAKKKAVPQNAQAVGVITSSEGAVIHDILTVSQRRNPCVDIVLYPVRVQGEQSAPMLVSALAYFCAQSVDVVIIGRGGGSDEDLAVFNNEAVVRAVAHCVKPVISAVGHESDHSLCDLAADTRAATPSEAAEICTLDTAAWKQSAVLRLNNCLEKMASELSAGTKLASLVSANFASSFDSVLAKNSNKVLNYYNQILLASEQSFNSKLIKLKMMSGAVEQNNPLKLLAQGYSALLSSGKRITSVGQVTQGQEITAYLKDGKIVAEVKGKE